MALGDVRSGPYGIDGSMCAERVEGRRFESRANVKSAKKYLTLAQPPLFELWLHFSSDR